MVVAAMTFGKLCNTLAGSSPPWAGVLDCHLVSEVAEGLAKPVHAPRGGFDVNFYHARIHFGSGRTAARMCGCDASTASGAMTVPKRSRLECGNITVKELAVVRFITVPA